MVPRDKLFGWKDFKGEPGEAEADYVTRFAVIMAKSERWYIKENPDRGSSKSRDLASRIANLPHWIYPAEEKSDEKTFAPNSYLAELGDECSFMDVPLETLAFVDLKGPIIYFRLDISGMRESLAVENES